MDVGVKCGDSRLNSGRIIRLIADRIRLHTFVQYLIAFYSRQKAASDVTSGVLVELIGMDVRIKFSVILGQTVLEIY